MPSFLITGAGRGIGLSLVASLVKDAKNKVIATARDPKNSEGLQTLAKQYTDASRLVVLPLDISQSAEITKIAEEVTKILPNGLDYLVNNAGVDFQGSATFENLDSDLFLKEIKLNTISIIEILTAFKPLLAKSQEKKVVTISSRLGSLTESVYTASVMRGYSITKAALNITIRKWTADHFAATGITSTLIHPGIVKTNIGAGVEGFAKVAGIPVITPEESAEHIVKLIGDSSKFSKNPEFYNYDGSSVPW
ncbi:hypothetical protein C8Q75DRAFT_762928 [Abortiporus biennis]|nr:hypothetical protein C8Q75DRAFT_762928 [Abortiporus biennis]